VKYEVYRDGEGKWHWRLVGPGGVLIAVSGASFDTPDACLGSVAMVKSSQFAAVVETEEG
jgi:uncharacterized protein YegP (UPF0339 family)